MGHVIPILGVMENTPGEIVKVKQNYQESTHQPLDCFATFLVALFVHVGMSKSQNQSLIPMVAPDITPSRLAPLLQEIGVTAMAAILETVISHSANSGSGSSSYRPGSSSGSYRPGSSSYRPGSSSGSYRPGSSNSNYGSTLPFRGSSNLNPSLDDILNGNVRDSSKKPTKSDAVIFDDA